jgi:hypothetical protein
LAFVITIGLAVGLSLDEVLRLQLARRWLQSRVYDTRGAPPRRLWRDLRFEAIADSGLDRRTTGVIEAGRNRAAGVLTACC